VAIRKIVTIPVLVAIAACMPMPMAAGVQQDVIDADQLAEQLERSAWAVFEAARARPSEQSGSMLKSFIRAGAERLSSEPHGEEARREADEAIRRFARAMVEAGERLQERNEDGSTRLGEGSFGEARSRICPLYPFC
jgi:hypothetical protein